MSTLQKLFWRTHSFLTGIVRGHIAIACSQLQSKYYRFNNALLHKNKHISVLQDIVSSRWTGVYFLATRKPKVAIAAY